MFRSVLLAGLAAAAFVPVLAHAQDQRGNCLEQKHDNRVVGTVLGGIGGALLGNAIGEHGGREGGAILGGVGGAVAGNAIGAGTVHCGSNRYGLAPLAESTIERKGNGAFLRDTGALAGSVTCE